jgi:uncharacterized protein YdeI (YjbR/CyaY-like superfamily)
MLLCHRATESSQVPFGQPESEGAMEQAFALERRNFAGWVDSVKDAKTRRTRAEKACMLIAAGKRRP